MPLPMPPIDHFSEATAFRYLKLAVNDKNWREYLITDSFSAAFWGVGQFEILNSSFNSGGKNRPLMHSGLRTAI